MSRMACAAMVGLVLIAVSGSAFAQGCGARSHGSSCISTSVYVENYPGRDFYYTLYDSNVGGVRYHYVPKPTVYERVVGTYDAFVATTKVLVYGRPKTGYETDNGGCPQMGYILVRPSVDDFGPSKVGTCRGGR